MTTFPPYALKNSSGCIFVKTEILEKYIHVMPQLVVRNYIRRHLRTDASVFNGQTQKYRAKKNNMSGVMMIDAKGLKV